MTALAFAPALSPREIIRDELEKFTGTEPDHYLVCQRVAARILPAITLDDLAALLMTMCREEASVRFAARNAAKPSNAKASAAAAKARTRASGAAYMKLMRSDVLVKNGGDPHRKFLRDCTRDDILSAADLRFNLARQNTEQGNRYKVLGAAMDKHKAKVVSDLPETVVLDILR